MQKNGEKKMEKIIEQDTYISIKDKNGNPLLGRSLIPKGSVITFEEDDVNG
jgi:hypothetical protein